MSKICLITGDHPRHKFLANRIIASNQVSCWVMEKREKIVPTPPVGINDSLKKLFIHHFRERERIENSVFGEFQNHESVPALEVDVDSLNSEDTIRFVNNYNPNLVISYGCHKLHQKFINNVTARFWNTHGGLSPEYRGVITHFWPSYFLEPQMTGMTLHETTDFLDGGELIFQTAAPMVQGDTLHRLAARNVEIFADQLKSKVQNLDFAKLPSGIKQKSYGRVFLFKYWRPEHLKLIYEVYEDRIVDAVIEKKIVGREPNLISVI